MVVFEGKAFDEKRVLSIESHEDSSWSKGVKDRYSVVMTFDDGKIMTWDRYLPETVTSKVNELVVLINKREEELLKLKAN